jgi:hypothetical protein
MSIKRTAILPAILALSTAGSIVAGTAASVLVSTAPAAVSAKAAKASPDYVYRG